jgi:hypothetical protein
MAYIVKDVYEFEGLTIEHSSCATEQWHQMKVTLDNGLIGASPKTNIRLPISYELNDRYFLAQLFNNIPVV